MRRQDQLPRWLLAATAVLVGGALLGPVPAGAEDPPGEVTMVDNRYDPWTAFVAQGQSIEFTNFGQVAHDARDATGLDLFDTGIVSPPDTATIGPLPGAGLYRYYCSFHPGMAGRVRVPVLASTTQSPAGSQVTVRWAATRAPAGLVFDVQRRRPGSDRFVDWRTGVTAAAANLWPSVRGQLAIRARVRASAGDAASDWSRPRVIRIT